MMIYLSLFMFISGLMVYCSKRNHLLLMLFSLEYMILSLYLNIYLYASSSGFDLFFLMIFLTMSVCESALGLSILVTMIRSCGNDYILTFSSLW